MKYAKRIRTAGFGLAALAFMGLSSCVNDPVVNVSRDNNEPVLRFTTETDGDAVFPTGSASLSDIVIAGFDFTVSDGFARAVQPADAFVQVDNPYGATGAYDVGASVPGSNTDSRLPAVQETGVTVDYWGLFNPAWSYGTAVHDLFGELSGLKPNTTYSVVIARMALTVNGDLDQDELLTGNSVASPDQLTFLGGTPIGYPDQECAYTAPVAITASTNPVMLGYVMTDGEGHVTVDCLPEATGDSPWYRDASTSSPAGATMPDSMPFGANVAGGTLAPGQFNYVMLYEGLGTETNPTPTANPAIRLQVGPDINSSGSVINNTMAPFPTGVADVSNLGALPGATDAFAAPGKISLTLAGLPAASGRTYQVWLYSRDTDSYTAAMTVTPDAGAADVELTDMDFGSFTHVVVSHEAGAATTPSDTKFLFKEYLTSSLALSDGAMTFGAFDGSGSTETFQVAGSGIGEFFSDSLFVQLRRLAPAPEGFHYQSYLAHFTGPDVDSSQRLHTITLDAVGNYKDRIGVSEVGDFASFNKYVLALEPDQVSMLTSLRVQVGEDYLSKFSDFFGGG